MHNFTFYGLFLCFETKQCGECWCVIITLQSQSQLQLVIFPSDNLGDILQNTLQIIRVILMVETTQHSSQNPPPPLLCDRDRWFACKLTALRCYSKLQNRPQKSDFSPQFVVFLSLPARLLSEPLHIQLNLLSFLLNLNIIKMIRTTNRRTSLGLFCVLTFN